MIKSLSWGCFDRAGMFVSFMCAIHCIALPILHPFLPLLAGSFFWAEGVEETVVAASLLIAGPTLFRGYLQHRQSWVLLAFGLGLAFILLRPCPVCSHNEKDEPCSSGH